MLKFSKDKSVNPLFAEQGHNIRSGKAEVTQDRTPQFQARGCALVLWGIRTPDSAGARQILGHGWRCATAILRGHLKVFQGVLPFAARAVVRA